ncbi:polysaccharide deacetylase family protein [Paenibacillus filicis]|uniref:Polysaccharide deacetylase family protein n=1 Tax=Paenibacillus filicis TaxID=669464 RepID=A0ABU9DJ86_9BACL
MLWLIAILSVMFLSPGFVHSGGSSVYYTDRVAVLAYHHIDDDTTGDVTISTDRFQGQLVDLGLRGYHFITLEQFRSYMQGQAVPSNAVLVTFDDGYESFYTKAFPVLQRLHVPAVNFVITHDLDHPGESLLPSLTPEEIRTMMAEDSDIDVQCHSDSLHAKSAGGDPLLTARLKNGDSLETDDAYDQRILADTRTSIGKLSMLKTGPVDTYAYPYGAYDSRSVGLLKQAGMQYAFTTQPGIVDRNSDPMQLPRINAGSPYVRMNSLNNTIMHKLQRSSSSTISTHTKRLAP